MKSVSCILLIRFLSLPAYAEEPQEQQVERPIRELQDADSDVLSIAAGALGNIRRGCSRCRAYSNSSIARSECGCSYVYEVEEGVVPLYGTV